MITLSYRRFNDGIYISHTDVLRSLNRTMRRADIEVAYSLGFHKHMNLKLTQPLPLGIASDDEWVTADVSESMDKTEFFEKFKACCPPYIEPTAVFYTKNNPSLAAKVIASKYEIICPNAGKFAKEVVALKNGFSVKMIKDGEEKIKDYTGYIYELSVRGDVIEGVFAFGNKNLRADTFLKVLYDKFGLDVPLTAVTRKEQLTELNGKLVPAKVYMESIS